jgi:hypothetical protein
MRLLWLLLWAAVPALCMTAVLALGLGMFACWLMDRKEDKEEG